MEDARDEKMLLVVAVVVALVAVRLEPDALYELHELRRWRMGLYFWDQRSNLRGPTQRVCSVAFSLDHRIATVDVGGVLKWVKEHDGRPRVECRPGSTSALYGTREDCKSVLVNRPERD